MSNFNNYINELDFSELIEFFLEKGVVTKYKKREFFCHQNQPTSHIGYIASGIFRYERTDSQENSHIVGYSFANDFVCDYTSIIRSTDSLVTAQAVTDSTIYLLSKQDIDDYWEMSMETQRFGRLAAETLFVDMYQRLLNFYCTTPIQRYTSLLQDRPDLLKHITLKEVASYIGVTPETVSHIRKKIL